MGQMKNQIILDMEEDSDCDIEQLATNIELQKELKNDFNVVKKIVIFLRRVINANKRK